MISLNRTQEHLRNLLSILVSYQYTRRPFENFQTATRVGQERQMDPIISTFFNRDWIKTMANCFRISLFQIFPPRLSFFNRSFQRWNKEKREKFLEKFLKKFAIQREIHSNNQIPSISFVLASLDRINIDHVTSTMALGFSSNSSLSAGFTFEI